MAIRHGKSDRKPGRKLKKETDFNFIQFSEWRGEVVRLTAIVGTFIDSVLSTVTDYDEGSFKDGKTMKKGEATRKQVFNSSCKLGTLSSTIKILSMET